MHSVIKKTHIHRKRFSVQTNMERVGAEIGENNTFQKKTLLRFDYSLGKVRNMFCKVVKNLCIHVHPCTIHYRKQQNLALAFKRRADNPFRLGADHKNKFERLRTPIASNNNASSYLTRNWFLHCLVVCWVTICSKQFLLSMKTNFERHFTTKILWNWHSIFIPWTRCKSPVCFKSKTHIITDHPRCFKDRKRHSYHAVSSFELHCSNFVSPV